MPGNTLITGGLGHIGSCLVSSLRMRRHLDISSRSAKIVVVDNLRTQRYPVLWEFGNDIQFRRANFQDLDTEFLSRFDTVIHLAAITDAAGSMRDSTDMWRTNFRYTKEFIETLDGLKRPPLFVFPSTTSVYGSANTVMFEDSNLNPQSPYAESKIAIEEWLRTQVDIPHVIFRFGTIFGVSTGMRYHTAINKFCWQAAMGEPLTIWKQNKKMKRPYLSLRTAEAVLYDTLWKSTRDQIVYETYNVVDLNVSLDDIKNIIEVTMSSYHRTTSINEVDTPLVNQYSYIVDSDKARTAFCDAHDTDGIKAFANERDSRQRLIDAIDDTICNLPECT